MPETPLKESGPYYLKKINIHRDIEDVKAREVRACIFPGWFVSTFHAWVASPQGRKVQKWRSPSPGVCAVER
jgi:hypothetical protein